MTVSCPAPTIIDEALIRRLPARSASVRALSSSGDVGLRPGSRATHAGIEEIQPRIEPRRRQQVIQAREGAEHLRGERLRGLLLRASRAILRTTAYTPRSACTGANEPRFGVPSSTTRSTLFMPSQASAARLTSPPMLCATIITRPVSARSALASPRPSSSMPSRQS